MESRHAVVGQRLALNGRLHHQARWTEADGPLCVGPIRGMGSKLFPGDGQMPINQDAIAQFMGFMGELTMTNPLFNWRLFDSNPAA